MDKVARQSQTRGRRENKEEKRRNKHFETKKVQGSGSLVGWSVIWRLFQDLNVV
jgi:hypothetical protein